MQMVIMTFRSSLEGEVLKMLEAERLSFPFVEKAHGKGETGHDLDVIFGSGINTMLFAGVQDEELSGFRERIHNWQRRLTGEGKVPLPLHLFVLPCIQWF
jgi:hypothetical protein